MRKVFGLFSVVTLALAIVGSVISAGGAASASFPGSNGLIVFSNGASIYTVEPDGGGLTLLGPGTEPEWDPTGRYIVFVASTEQGQGVHVMRADGSKVRFLAPGIDPTWSPDGRWIAFTRTSEAGTGIHVMRLNGKKVRFLASGFDPSWSPDGTKIAFATNDPQFGSSISVIDVDGSDLTTLVSGADVGDRELSNPDWAPSGGTLAFVATDFSGCFPSVYIFIVRADGTELRDIAFLEEAYPSQFSWSPDGTKLVVSYLRIIESLPECFAVSSLDLAVIDLATGIPSGVTESDDVDEVDPDWQPLKP
jgi:TolB protein